MSDVSQTLVIDSSVSRVWQVLSDTGRYSEWVESCIAVTYHHGPAALGGIYRERNHFLGPFKPGTTWTVAELDPPRYRRDVGAGMPLLTGLEAIFELEPVAGGDGREQTRLTYRNRYRVALGPLGRVIDRLQRPGLEAMMKRSMDTLAEVVQGTNR